LQKNSASTPAPNAYQSRSCFDNTDKKIHGPFIGQEKRLGILNQGANTPAPNHYRWEDAINRFSWKNPHCIISKERNKNKNASASSLAQLGTPGPGNYNRKSQF
jgi:hypothetical protein